MLIIVPTGRGKDVKSSVDKKVGKEKVRKAIFLMVVHLIDGVSRSFSDAG